MTDPHQPAGRPSPLPLPPANPTPPGSVPTGSPSRRLLSGAVGVALLVLAALVAGVAVGWIAHARWAPQPAPIVAGGEIVVPTLPPAEVAQTENPVLPDVRGLTQADAEQAFADSGVKIGKVIVEQRPHVGPAGTIIAQTPIGGSVVTGDVTIVLPTPATMPDLKGQSEGVARKSLQELGSFVSIDHRYQEGAVAGQIIESVPAAGAELGEESTVIIADPPSSRFLTEIKSSGSCSSSSVTMNGTKYEHGFYCGAASTAREQVWLLGRKVSRITGVAGVVDTSTPGVNAVVKIVGDDKELYSGQVSYGAVTAIDVPTAGVLRLSITVQLVDPAAKSSPQVGFGDLVIAGAEADLAQLVTG